MEYVNLGLNIITLLAVLLLANKVKTEVRTQCKQAIHEMFIKSKSDSSKLTHKEKSIASN